MKMTLLEITQDILNSMDSDTVNSISDTVESDQVALTIKSTYYDLISNNLIVPEHKEIITLTALGDSAHPTYFSIPDTVKEIEYFRYNKEDNTDTDLNYVDLTWLEPFEFQRRVNSRTEGDSNITAYSDFNAGQLLIQTDKHPEFWTSFDDKYIVCDSFLTGVDATLQASKVFCYGLTEPTWTHSSSFTPDLDTNLFSLLLEEARSTCFVNFKQVSNAKSEKKARRQATMLHNKLHRTGENYHDRQPNYGR